MAKHLLFLALCFLPALISAGRPARNPFILTGRVYCDTCRAGFETSATTYIQGAKVKVECRDRETMALKYKNGGITDATGTYKIEVAEDHEDDVCDCILESSPLKHCSSTEGGRNKSRVILTRNNGIVNYERYANALGFMMNKPMSGCAQVLKQYQETED